MVENTTKKDGIVEAAADVLAASIRNAGSEPFGLGKGQNPAGIYHPPIDLGPIQNFFGDDPHSNYLKGVPTAVPPGQTPPVGSEPMKTLEKDRGEEHATLQKTMGYGGKVNPSNIQNGEGGMRPNFDSMSKRQGNVKSYATPGAGNVLPPWAHEEVSVDDLAAALVEEIGKLDEVAFRYRKITKAEQKKRRAATEKAPVKRSYPKEKVAKIKEALAQTELPELTEEDIVDFLDEMFPIEEVVEQTFQDRVQEILASTKNTYAEDINAVFNGENLSEDFMAKAATIFETAVSTRVALIAEELEQIAVEQLDEAAAAIEEQLTEQVDSYLNYMVNEWITENEIAIEKGLKAEIVEDFITGLRTLFMEHYIDIPEDKVDLVAELSAKVDELSESLNAEIAKNIELSDEIAEARKLEVLDAVCEGLTKQQVDKVRTLAESVEFTTEDEFTNKVKLLRENYFPTGTKVNAPRNRLDFLNEGQMDEGPLGQEISDPLMKIFSETISRTVKQ